MPIAKVRKLKLAPAPSPAESSDSSKYEVLFDQGSDAIIVVKANGVIDSVNQAVEELTGYLKSELIGASADILVPDPTKMMSSHRSRPIDVLFFSAPGTYEDLAVRKKDGYVRYVDLSVRVIQSGGKSLSMALLRDITEKKQMERELITKHSELRNAYFQLEKQNAELQAMQDTLVQSGKMAALGELAAGIAHELNQPLQGIRGYAQEIRELSSPLIQNNMYTGEIEVGFREIISNVDKMVMIIDHLRTFTRKSVEKCENVDVHYVVEEALKMLSRQFATRGIVVEKKFKPDLPKIYANPFQLEQVFINLATNARDAIEATGRGKGTITISTRDTKDFVEVIFQDDGCGMNDRTKAKAFNPFFSTKEVGKGMGLGLSLSYGILSKLHGSIVVESELGKGAKFLVRIPKDFREIA